MDIHHYYTEKGSGEVLILLHGNGGSSAELKNQSEEFSPYFRVIAIDTRGHGKTPRGKAPFTIRQFADDLCAFMDEKGIEKTNIIGFSDGGNIALCFALKYPNRVNRLVLNGANLYPWGVKAYFQVPVFLGYHFAKMFKNEKAKANAEMLGLMVNDPYIAPEALHTIKCKTLVVAGTHDLILKKHTKLIADNIPHCEIKFVRGIHSANNTNPAKNHQILDFLKN